MTTSTQLDSWLEEEDVDRLWKVAHGLLPDVAATSDEMAEFLRIVTHAAMLKVAGNDYQQYNVH
jgi:hypothetical protein